jgi:FlaA1/EpsC-like NDP-sugar epimerase
MMGKGGEIFILQMGSPIKIMEIAKDLIALHGLRLDEDIAIKRTGLRRGEKLHENLVADGELIEESPHSYILTTRPGLPDGWDRQRVLGRLGELVEHGDGAEIRSFLDSVIPDAELSS